MRSTTARTSELPPSVSLRQTEDTPDQTIPENCTCGARLGSITGVLAFLSLVIIIGLTIALTGKELFEEVLRQNPDASRVLNNAPALAVTAVLVLLILFAMVVGMCAVGGALGARFAA